MTTKRAKKVVVYLASLLVIFTLITTCLLGNTFAKYITGGYGGGDADVSLWTVGFSGALNESTTVNFETDTFSPDETGAGLGVNYNVSTVPTNYLVAKITIDSSTEVDVDVCIDVSALSYTTTGATIDTGTSADYDGAGTSTPNSYDMAKVFTLYAGYITSTTESSAPTLTLDTTKAYGSNSASATWNTIGLGSQSKVEWTRQTSTTYIYIYAWVVWSTDYTYYNDKGTNGKNSHGIYVADALDTWIGSNITNLTTTINVVAVQSSTQN